MSDSLLGSKIGHVRFVSKIATGGMGEVYAGYDETLQRRVAIKGIRQEFHLSEEAKGRFLREARVLSQLGHPNICQIYDYVEGEKSGFIVMELVEGKSLARAIKKGIAPQAKMRIAEEIASVLVAAHEKGVIHRDLKPDNVMLSEDEQVKVLDFGLSRQLGDEATWGVELASAQILHATPKAGGVLGPAEGSSSSMQPEGLTTAGAIMGTVGYMSPEQARGEQATSASDMYSFGLLLQEIFTGKPPIEPGLDMMARLEKARLGETLPASGLDPDLEALINRLKSVAPGARPSAQDAVQRLAWIGEKPSRRRKKLLLSAAVAVLAVFSIAMTVQSIRATRAEKHAREEAETAKRVSDFLTSIFKVSDPSEARGNTVTAREILDKGARQIRSELGGQPLVQAKLLDTIGDVYMGLGLYQEAKPLLAKAVNTCEKAKPKGAEMAQGLLSLADYYRNQGEFKEAEPLYLRALAIRKNILGPDDPDVASAVNGLANVYADQGKDAEAEPLFKQALAIRERVLGPASLDVAESLNDLGQFYQDRGNGKEAEPLLKRALDVLEKKFGSDCPEVAIDLNNLATLYVQQGRLSEAEPLYERALAINEKVLGPGHADIGIGLNNLACLLRDEGRFTQAQPLYARALSIWEKAFGEEHLYVASCLTNMGLLSQYQGKYGEAEAYYKRAIGIRENLVGKSHPRVAIGLIRLGELYVQEGNATEAELYFKQALAIYKSPSGGSSEDVASALSGLACCEWREKKFEAAIGDSDRCIEMRREAKAPPAEAEKAAFLLGEAILTKGRAQAGLGNSAEAQASWSEAVSLIKPYAQSSEEIRDQCIYAEALLCLDKVDEAKPIVRKLFATGYKSPDLLALCREKRLHPYLPVQERGRGGASWPEWTQQGEKHRQIVTNGPETGRWRRSVRSRTPASCLHEGNRGQILLSSISQMLAPLGLPRFILIVLPNSKPLTQNSQPS